MESIENTAKKVSHLGGKPLTPKIAIGEHGSTMHVLDSEGNLIALWEPNREPHGHAK